MLKKIVLVFFLLFFSGFSEVKGISIETLKSAIRDQIRNLKDEDKEGWRNLLTDIEEGEKVYPEEIFFPYWKIYVYERLQDDEGVLRSIDVVLKRDESFKELYEIKGDVLFKQKKYQEAVDVYLKGLERSKGANDFFLRIGKAYEFLGDFAKAVDYYTRYSFMNPKDPRSYIQIAKIYIFLDDSKKELEFLKKGLDKSKDSVFLYYMGSYYERIGDMDKAVTSYEQYLDKTDDKATVLRLAGLYRMLGKLKEAKELYEGVLKKDPNDFIFETQLSHVCMDLRDDVCAEESLWRLVDMPESASQNGVDLMIFYQKKNDLQGALKAIEKTIEKYPDQTRLYGYRGDLRFAMGDYERASVDYEKMKETYPEEYEKAFDNLRDFLEKRKSDENDIKMRVQSP